MTSRVPPIFLLTVALAMSACTDDALPTGALAQTKPIADAPVINQVAANNEGEGVVLLSAKATNPTGGTLNFKWTTDKGELRSTSGAQVRWKPPKEPGTYVATVEVSNSKGVTSTARQPFSVSADGKASVAGTLEVAATPITGGAVAGRGTVGQFTVPTALPARVATPVFVNGVTTPAGNPTPPAVFNQPIANPPATTPLVPNIPQPQPIATPTTTPPPVAPLVSPPPTPRPPTPKPGVPLPPPSRWNQVSPFNVPTTNPLRAVTMLRGGDGTYKEGWAVGDGGIAIHTSDGGKTWDKLNTGLPANAFLKKVAFATPDAGFATDNLAVYRYKGGVDKKWEKVSDRLPSAIAGFGAIIALNVYNEQIVGLATSSGNAFRSENANADTAAGVSWNTLDSKGDVANATSDLKGGAAFSTAADTSIGWFAGDGIYRLDSDAGAPAPLWKRWATIPTASGTAMAIDQGSVNDVWVGTSSGHLFFSTNGATADPTFSAITVFRNREFNGNFATLNVASIYDVSVLDANNVFVLRNLEMLDTNNGGASWKLSQLPISMNDIVIGDELDAKGQRKFVGIGVGTYGVARYVPE